MHDRFAGPADPRPAHVGADELRDRLARLRVRIGAEGLDALLVFAPESHYWATGLDTGGYVFFQCGIVPVQGDLTLLTRRPDLAQARDTSLYPDIRVWYDAVDAAPAAELRAILAEKGLAGARIGIERATYGLTAANGRAVDIALDGFCTLIDADHLIRRMRLVKSASEVAVIRRAAALADAAVAAMRAAAAPGILDSVLTARCLATILEGGGDMPPAGPLVNSGRRAIYGRGVAGPRRLEPRDQVVVEFAATLHRYNACIERTILLGEPPAAQRRMAETVARAMDAMVDAARPGAPIGAIGEAHRRVLDAAGYTHARFAACGYPLGATFRPSWMDVPPMIHAGNPWPIEPGMVLFPHAMLGDAETGLAFGAGDTILITPTGAERLTVAPFL
ncbi:aminopeptidase P family protein [Elioraea sp. Yellowstone]|jgi:Xaa-Pro dipeptidase|uniref:M24 family metallopeptidase n=1 Tax=Elioraea sp. Yellowstone TaxID=2592070 RepID=UPI00114FCD68|nr:Xaa-Pro peptidase family protein [Elioraea sp. Yellowstone]TQF77758.1 aminopeptidase P family protein [Elioraea sp. Yellowstone]